MRKTLASLTPSNAIPQPLMDMNMTPLIDVMLVLIIMLIITIPKQNHAVNLNMPQTSNMDAKPDIVSIELDFDGTVLWNGVALPDRATLERKLSTVAAARSPTQVQLRANKLVAYKAVAGVMASAQRLGVRNIGMVGNEVFI